MAYPLPVPDAGALVPRPFRVLRVRKELKDTWTLEFSPGLPFRPGQFTMVYVFGLGEVPISISGDPAKPDVLVHTVRAVGPVTRALCATRKGGVLGIRGPFGTAWPVDAAEGRDVVFMAGGLGLAPLRPAVHAVLAERARYGRVSVLVGARTPADLLYARELERWRRSGLDVQVTVDAADPSWRGDVGLVTALLPRARFDADRAAAFVCGPEIMMRFGAEALVERGVDPRAVFVSLERNMKCAVAVCGHCQFGPTIVCRDGAVFPYDRVSSLMRIREI